MDSHLLLKEALAQPISEEREPLSPKRGDAPAAAARPRARRSSAARQGEGGGGSSRKAAAAKAASLKKHATLAAAQTGCLEVPRAMYGSHAAQHRARGNGLYRLTGQLLVGCYLFVGLHATLLQVHPEVFSQLRYPPAFGHPLLLLPQQEALFGWFFSYINGSIQQFVMRGVLGALVFICLLHLVRVVLFPIASAEQRLMAAEDGAEGNRRGADRQKRAGLLKRLLRTAWSAQQRFHRRRERFCARLVGLVCLALTVIQVSSFFFGGWTLKAIGFPDIYLGALTKPGGLKGFETAEDVLMQNADLVDLSHEELRESMHAIGGEERNQLLLILTLVAGFALDAWGQYLQIKAIRRYLSKGVLLTAIAVSAGVLSFASYNLTGAPSCNSQDHHWVDFELQRSKGHLTEADGAYLAANPPVMYSEYLPMRDGVRLAADVYLPFSLERTARSWAQLQHRRHVVSEAAKQAKELLLRSPSASGEADNRQRERLLRLVTAFERVEERLNEEEDAIRRHVQGIPVYLEITRYNRRSEHFWPFTLLSIWGHPRGSSVNIWSWQTQQILSANEYAVVVVDTRGSGASFGSRPVDLGEDELRDSSELIRWSKSQWFSNGKVAGGGLSYDGMLGLSMAAGGGVDAVISLFTPMDVMRELLAPGGALCHSFLNDYTGLTSDFEHHGSPWRHMIRNPLQFPLHVLLGFMFSFGGTSAVLGHEAELPLAIRSHRPNWKMTDAVSSIRFYDDEVRFNDHFQAAATSFGVTERIMQKLAERKVNLLMVSGFCDSATARGAVRLFSYMQEHAPETKPQLILGNWNHGGRRTCDPYGGTFSCFESDLYASVLRFFDCRLKKKCWGGIEEEAPVHYWQTGSSEWRTADSFPPKEGMQHLDLGLTSQSVRLAPHDWNGGPHHTTAFTVEPANSKRLQPARSKAAAGGGWAPHLGDLTPSSLEHTLHDITQRVQLYANMMELHEEARVSAELLGAPLASSSKPRSRRSWASRMLAALIAALSSASQRNAGGDLREIFSHDENAYFLRLPSDGEDSSERMKQQTEEQTTVEYSVEYLSTSGEYSRWTIAQHPFRLSVNYGNRLFQRKKRPDFALTVSGAEEEQHAAPVSLSPFSIESLLARPLSFVTEPLEQAVQMVGSAFLHLTVAVEACDEVSVFAYLEDLDLSSGYSHYVTEGQVVASNRPSGSLRDLPVGAYGRLIRSFFRRDSIAVNEKGENVVVSLSFEPNAWTFREGHSIRLVLTGSDNDNFSLPRGSDVVLPKKWKVLTNSAFLSLPVLVDQQQ
ncbi:hypothetical protein Efla_001818 [Eimeria flavescens]